MKILLLFLVAKLAPLFFGSPLFFFPFWKRLPMWTKVPLAYGAGAVVLTVAMTLFSIAGVPWSALSIALFVTLGIACALFVAKRIGGGETATTDRVGRDGWQIASAAIVALALAHLFASLLATQGTSADYIFSWGSKAAHWAAMRGFGGSFLADPFMMHLHTTYPPLVPALYAWDALVDGRMLWRPELLSTWLWTALTSVAIFGHFLRKTSALSSGAITALWSVAISVSLIASGSGGNAEAPLLFFASIAALMLMTEDDDPAYRIVVSLLLTGLVLTKIEGLVIAFAIVGGSAFTRPVPRRPVVRTLALLAVPLASLGLWWTYQWIHGIPMSDPTREKAFHLTLRNAATVSVSMIRNFDVATAGVPWLIAVATIVVVGRRCRVAWISAAIALSLILFYFGYYLHVTNNPADLVRWTFPRIVQVPVSLTILGGGLALASASAESEA